MSLDSWVDRSLSVPSGVAVLLSKLHGCINQLEQFPVRVHELPGRRCMIYTIMADMHMSVHACACTRARIRTREKVCCEFHVVLLSAEGHML